MDLAAYMTIGGQQQAAAEFFEVTNPAKGGPFARVPSCSKEQLDEAMSAASAALPSWAEDEASRCRLLEEAALALEGAVDQIALLITAEQGRPYEQSRQEVRRSAQWFRHFANTDYDGDSLVDPEGQRSLRVRRRPIGVVAAITPWNFPVLLACWKIAPALRAGNTVVLKPSPYAPLSALSACQAMNGVLPPGVLSAISGNDDLGMRMVRHPVPGKISLTGSVEAGKAVAKGAATGLKRVTLELGGNDPAVVLADADVETTADGIFRAAFSNAGQICTGVKRVYADASIYRRLVDALADRAKSTTVGDGMSPETQMGPVSTRPQIERVQKLVREAIDQGGTAITGGDRLDGPGFFFPPTIVVDVDDGVALVDEEQFGPALPIIRVDDFDDAIARANRTRFGLGGSIWSADLEGAANLAERLECGTAWVNAHSLLAPYQPFRGWKASGIGVENGLPGLRSFSDEQIVSVPIGAAR